MSEGITKEEIIEEFKGNKILKYSTYIVGAIVLAGLIYLAYNKFIAGPKNLESESAVANGIMYLQKDSTKKAISEFEYLTDEYNGYKGGEIAQYALGNLYYKQGNYEAALNELKDVNIEDTYLMTLAIGAQGDCYSQLKDYPNAVKMYIKAAERDDNDATSPIYYFKAGLNAAAAGDYEKAASYYQIIKDKYPMYASQKEIEKYITRAKNTTVKSSGNSK